MRQMSETTANIIRALGVALLLSVSVARAYAYLPDGIDWRDTYRPAALA